MEFDEHYLTLYSIIRSNNTDSLEDWLKVTKMPSASVYHLLGAAYEALHLKNIPISFPMRYLVELTLSQVQFVTQNYEHPIDDFKAFAQIKRHLDLTCRLIESLFEHSKTQWKTTLSFINDVKLVTSHISVLKKRVDFSYNKLPWEEIEFCLVLLVFVLTKPKEADLTYKLIIDKERIIKLLQCFFEELSDFRSWFIEEESAKGLQPIKIKLQKLNIEGQQKGRKGNKQAILHNSPQFGDLYQDFSLLRDVYSSNRIKHYLEVALSVDLDANPTLGYLVIQRALQVIGEYLKNEKDSPNYSAELYQQLLKLLTGANLLNTTSSLRNMMSHSHTLGTRLEMEKNDNKGIFKNIQAELKTIHDEIVRVLYKIRIDALKVVLEKLLHCGNTEQMQKILQHVQVFDSDLLTDIEVQDLFSVKNSIATFWQEITNYADDDSTLTNFLDIINDYESFVKTALSCYNDAINMLSRTSPSEELATIQNLALSYLGVLNSSTIKKIFEDGVFDPLTIIFQKLLDYCKLPNEETSRYFQRRATDFHKRDFHKIDWLEKMENELASKNNVDDYWKAHLQKLFETIQEALDSDEGLSFRASVAKEKDMHTARENLLNSMMHEDFENILNSMNLKSQIEKMIVSCYNKKQYKELEQRIKGRIPDAYGLLFKNLYKLGDIFPLDKYFAYLKKFYSELGLNKTLFNKILQLTEDITLQDIKQPYCKRLSTLGDVLSMVLSGPALTPSLEAALEMLILDLTEYIEKTGGLGDNKTFLVEKLPLLRGKQLRNHLAHGNIMVHILPYVTEALLLAYGAGLLELGDKIITERSKWIVGFKFNIDDDDMSSHIIKCQDLVRLQDNLFGSIEEERFEDSLFLIQAGVDVYGKDANGCSVLDLAIKNKNEVFIDYFILNFVKEQNVFQFATPQMIMSDFETFNKFLKTTNLDLEFIDIDGSSLLHTAAALGQVEIVQCLLQNKADLNKRNINGETVFHLACKNGSVAVALLLMDANANFINNQTTNGATALHYGASKGHCGVVNELIKRHADISLKRCDDLTAFQLAVIYDHEGTVNVFLEKCQMTLDEKTEGLLLACTYGRSCIVDMFLKEVAIHVKVNEAAYAAVLCGHTNVVAILLNHGAKVNWKHVNDATLLHIASKNNHLGMMNVLLDNKAEVNARNYKMWTPLHYAFQTNSLNAIDLLISKGADVNLCNTDGKTPLHLAAKNGNTDCIKLLLKIFPTTDVNKLTEETKKSALNLAAYEGHIDTVKLLVNKGGNVNLQDTDQLTPLHYAIHSYGYTDVVSYLIQQDAININLQDTSGSTPLHHAVIVKNEEIVDVLLQHKADANIAMISGNTPLHSAAFYGFTEIARKLLENGASCNLLNEDGLSALHTAAEEGHLSVIKVLLERDETSLNERDIFSATALLRAINGEHEDVATFLVKNGAVVDQEVFLRSIKQGMSNTVLEIIKSGININELSDSTGLTPLIMALIEGHESIALLLLEQKEIDVRSCDKWGWTALHAACMKGLKSCVAKILTLKPDVNAKTEEQKTPLYLAAVNGHDDVIKELLLHDAMVDQTVGSTLLPTALCYAVWKGHKDVVATLIQHHADVNIRCRRSTTPLHIAVGEGHLEIIKLILDSDRTLIDAVTDKRYTALHFAAMDGNSEIMSLLLRRDVSDIINAVSEDGDTALHLAACRGHKEIIDMLIQANADITIRNLEGLIPEDAAANNGFGGMAELSKKK